MGLIKVYGEEGEKQVVTVALRVHRRLPNKQLLYAVAVFTVIEFAALAAYLYLFTR